MAANKAYGRGAVMGSLAYDFENPALWPEEATYRQPERRVVIPAPPQVKDEVKAAAKVRTSQSVSPAAIVGYICAAVMIVVLLMAKIQLTVVTDRAAGLETQLASLETAQSRLLIDYESAFNLSEIEEYATSVLGMQRPRDEQIYYLEGAIPDKAVVLENQSEGGLINEIKKMLSAVGEYFR